MIVRNEEMTNEQTECLVLYMDGWTRGTTDKEPKQPDSKMYMRGYVDGMNARLKALDHGIAFLSAPVTVETARSLIAHAIEETRGSKTSGLDVDSSIVKPLEPMDPMFARFNEIRERRLAATNVPVGATIDHEFNEDGSRRRERRATQSTNVEGAVAKNGTDAVAWLPENKSGAT